VAGDRVVETPERASCRAAQTPQVFRRALLTEGLAKARALGREATDDAQLVEWLGVAVHVVEGDPANLKITDPADLARAEAWLRRREEGVA
jgi:2-C-methyl-D-erythritol 4-phosphate cytidylyltransferase